MAKCVLIVDDDPDVVLFLSTVLHDHGYETLEASDGRQGYETARSERPDLILLDLMMPHKSGLALLNDLKQDEILGKIPVVMVTGVTGETGIDLEAFFKGPPSEDRHGPPRPEGYIEKPVAPETLLSVVKELLKDP